MKRVSFKVAKALKEAGYPQKGSWYYSPDGRIGDVEPDDVDFAAPTYLDVWLWLWREKDIKIVVSPNCLCIWIGLKCINLDSKLTNNPEDAVIAAIEYLVDNELLK